MFNGRMPLQKRKNIHRKLQKKILYLCFGLMRVLFGIYYLGLRLFIFGLETTSRIVKASLDCFALTGD